MARQIGDSQDRVHRALSQHFEQVQNQLKSTELKLQELGSVGQSISDLNSLLKLPHLRGGFGEAALERILADFLPAGSYDLQHVVVPGSTERVDAVVRLHRQLLPIDSKFPREQVLPLFDSKDPGALERARKALSEFVRGQARQIAQKYIRPDCGTTEMAMLFLPSETLYFEVIRDTRLFESLAALKVFPVSPNTLAITLHSISMAQEYYTMARGVEKTIADISRARKHFENLMGRMDEVGAALKKAQDSFDTARTHVSRYSSSVNGLLENQSLAPVQSKSANDASQCVPP
jgi:DNA recombination protein RmuC